MTAAPPEQATPSTRDRILAEAERLFAEQGYNGVSLRTITAAAEANMAAVHYYFGTKPALLQAIFETRARPLSEERERGLAQAIAAAPNGVPPVRAVLAAFVGPGIRLGATPAGAVFNRLSAICSVDPDPDVKRIVFAVHDSAAQPFVQALRSACPALEAEAFFVRVQCVFGSMMYIRADNGRVDRLLTEQARPSEPDKVLEHLLDFLAAGFEPVAKRPAARPRARGR